MSNPPIQNCAAADQPASFVDPADDDTLSIHPHLGVYYRLTIVGHKLSELIAIVPELAELAIIMRNSSSGCWVAFTSTRVAMRIGAQVHLPHVMELVNQNGCRLCFKGHLRK